MKGGGGLAFCPHVLSLLFCFFVCVLDLSCAGSHDARLVVWDALTGTFLAHMEQHMRTITSVVWLESDSAKKKSGACLWCCQLLALAWRVS